MVARPNRHLQQGCATIEYVDRRPFIAALLLGSLAAVGLVLNLHAGYWPFALALGLIIFGLVMAIGMSLVGSWPAGVGAAGIFLLVFVLLAPATCSSQSHPSKTSCTGLIPIALPGYEGRGSFSPSYLVPIATSVFLALAFLVLVKRRQIPKT